MIRKTLQEEIRRILPHGQVKYDERLDRHCSFRTGGLADALVFVRTAGELAALLALLRAEGTEYFILGRGTNLLIGDGGYRGVVITPFAPSGAEASGTEAPGTEASGMEASRAEASGTEVSGAEASEEGCGAESGTNPKLGEEASGAVCRTACDTDSAEKRNAETAEGCFADFFKKEQPFPLNGIRVLGDGRILAGAGASLHAVSAAAVERGLSGLEFASGIPGTVGGALVMNAGAYDGEMKQVVRSVSCMMPDGKEVVLSGEEMEFGYRTSVLKRVPMIALGAEFILRPGEPEQIRERIRDFAARRREKQPLEYPSAGSTFKRPEGLFAGKLIMDAGLRGYRVGDAQVSEKHCGFVINRGGATSAQIRKLIEDVQRMVLENSGVLLEREVIFLGEF